MTLYEMNRILLEGDFSIAGAKEQFSLLTKHLEKVTEGVPAAHDKLPPIEIDLTGVQYLDACGCQLLALFLRNLRQQGVEVLPLRFSNEYREKIHLLGFDDEFLAGE